MAPNTTTIDIRAATSADAPAIASIHVASWQATYMDIMPAQFLADLSVEKRMAAWRETLDAGRPHVALAFANHAPTGWIAYGPTRDADKDGAWGEIEAIYLPRRIAGKGSARG
nr:hypothetical protein [Burkholderia cenocepacia]